MTDKDVVLITDVKDVTKLQGMVTDLWCLLDDIDTLDDACKSNDGAFRNLCRNTQMKRHRVLTSDGYNLHLPDKSK